jgi:hypothetical protein
MYRSAWVSGKLSLTDERKFTEIGRLLVWHLTGLMGGRGGGPLGGYCTRTRWRDRRGRWKRCLTKRGVSHSAISTASGFL